MNQPFGRSTDHSKGFGINPSYLARQKKIEQKKELIKQMDIHKKKEAAKKKKAVKLDFKNKTAKHNRKKAA